MSMRIFSVLCCGVFALSACASESGMPQGDAVDCALGGSSTFALVCVLERNGGGDFTIYAPDGGFQRFRYERADNVVTLADGADERVFKPQPGAESLEIVTGSNRYRLDLDVISNAES